MKTTAHSHDVGDAELRSVMDVEEALQRLGNDEELLGDIVQVYLEDAPGIVERVRAAVAAGDCTALLRAAHSLKGLAATLSAHDVIGAALKLEHLAAAKNLGEAPEALVQLDRSVAQLNQAVKKFLPVK